MTPGITALETMPSPLKRFVMPTENKTFAVLD